MKTKQHLWGLIGLILLAGLLSACDPASYTYLEVNRVGIIDQQPYLRTYINGDLDWRWLWVGMVVLLDLILSFFAMSSFVQRTPTPVEEGKGETVFEEDTHSSAT